MDNFYERYIKLCNSVNKTPSAVALEMGLSKTAVNGWKHGRSKPTDATLRKISDYFGVSTDYLKDGEQQKKPAQEMGERDYSDMALLDAFNRADEATKAAIRLLLKVE